MFAVLLACVAVAAGVVSHNIIAVRDHDFVGEDPVLSAELARRMPPQRRKAEQLDPPHPLLPDAAMVKQLSRLSFFGVLQDELNPAAPSSNIIFDENLGTNKTSTSNGTGSRRTQMESTPQWVSYPKDDRHRHLYGLHLKAAEQAIYSAQYRIQDVKWITERYKQDKRFRISYMLSKISEWKDEALVLYTYSHRIGSSTFHRVPNKDSWYRELEAVDRNQPRQMNVFLHIIYYTHILKIYIDMVYTTEFLLQTHGAMHNETLAKMGKNHF